MNGGAMGTGVTEIESRVKKVIANILMIDEGTISNNSTIAELGGDSLAALGILSALEQEFDIRISDADAAKISSCGTAIEVVNKILTI